MATSMIPEAGGQPVPGMVRLMTTEPLVVSRAVMDDRGALAAQLEERPWLVAVAMLGLLGVLLVARRREA